MVDSGKLPVKNDYALVEITALAVKEKMTLDLDLLSLFVASGNES